MVSQEQYDMQRYYALPNSNLKSYLARQVRGTDKVVRTPFARDEEPSEVLSQWYTHLEQNLVDWPSLLTFENDMRAKVGPMSVQKPLAERFPSLLSYYTLPKVGEPFSTAVTALMSNEWSRARGMNVRSIPQTVAHMKLSTNSGSPYFTVRRNVLEQSLPYTLRRLGDSVYSVRDSRGEWLLTATYGWRGQEGGPNESDVKQRDLWMFPMVGNIEELRVYQPLIEVAQRFNLIPPWNGLPYVDAAITRLFDTKADHDLVVCTDFTKFDQHFGPSMQDGARFMLSRLFTQSAEFKSWSETVFPMKYDIPICFGWSRFLVGTHGMASGSGGTNADETLAHRLLQHEAARDAGVGLNLNSMCLGDDGVLSYPKASVDQIVETYSRHGLEMNTEKQSASNEHCVFLRHWHHREYRRNGICVGVYPTCRALGHLMFMERFIDPDKWGVKAVAMRQLSILENCRYHPLGSNFVKFCIKRDKYRLGIDIPGFLDKIDAIYQEAKANGTLHISYSQEFGVARPPSEWWIVKELQSLR